MRSLLLSLPVCALLLGCQNQGPDHQSDLITQFKNVTVIDAVSGVQAQQDVFIQSGDILRVSPHDPGGLQVRADTVIDGTDQYLIPGLWDAHVHLAYDDAIDESVFFPLSLAHGVTSLRDTGGHLERLAKARNLSQTDQSQPDLFISGPLLDGPKRVYDGAAPGFPDLSARVASPEEADETVQRLVSQGVDFLKVYEMLDPETFRALGKAAETFDLPIAAHIPLSMTSAETVEAGARDFQHLRNLELSCAPDADKGARERRRRIAEVDDLHPGRLRASLHADYRPKAIATYDPRICGTELDRLAEYQVHQTPTLTITRFFTRRLFEDADYVKSFEMMPASIAKGWKERSARLVGRNADDAALAFDNWVLSMIPALYEAGVPIMVGTDAPIGFLTPGASLHEEMIMLNEAGLPALETLKAATLTPALWLGLEDRGLITPGYKADLVLLKADPLSDMQNIKQIRGVMKNGIWMDQDALQKRLETVRRSSSERPAEPQDQGQTP